MTYLWNKNGANKRKLEIPNYKEEIFRREFEQAINDSHHSAGPIKKVKRFRSAFTTEQVNYLEKEFRKYPYIGNARRKDVANVLDIPERAVKIWFQNRRMKEKKDATNKEPDIGEQKQGLEIANDQLNNLSITQLANKQRSLPILSVTEEEKMNNDKDLANDLTTKPTDSASTRGSRSYKDLSCNKEVEAKLKVDKVSAIIKSCGMSETNSSAEFSIELLKKYKHECDGIKEENTMKKAVDNSDSKIKDSLSSLVGPMHLKIDEHKPQFTSYSPISPMPQDLSSCQTNASQLQQRVCNKSASIPPTNTDSVDNPDIPLYLRGFYTQPYLPPGNMIWKPVNIAPVMPPSIATLSLPSNSGTLPLGQQHLSRRNCNCDCHLKAFSSPLVFQQNSHNPQVQYVITAVPCQNNTKFGIH